MTYNKLKWNPNIKPTDEIPGPSQSSFSSKGHTLMLFNSHTTKSALYITDKQHIYSPAVVYVLIASFVTFPYKTFFALHYNLQPSSLLQPLKILINCCILQISFKVHKIPPWISLKCNSWMTIYWKGEIQPSQSAADTLYAIQKYRFIYSSKVSRSLTYSCNSHFLFSSSFSDKIYKKILVVKSQRTGLKSGKKIV